MWSDIQQRLYNKVVKNMGALEMDVVGSDLTSVNLLIVWPQQITEFPCAPFPPSVS